MGYLTLEKRADRACSGFTLLEIMVVLVVIAIVTGGALLSIGGGSHQRLTSEAQRLQNTLQLAADEAAIEGVEIAASLTQTSYAFARYDPLKRQWQPYSERALRRYTLPGDMQLAWVQQGKPAPITDAKKNKPFIPSLLFLSSGESSAFTLQLSTDSAHRTLVSDGVSPIRLIGESSAP